MKKVTVSIIVLGVLAAFSFHTNANARGFSSYKQSSTLVQLMSELEEIASQGASLAFYEYKENFAEFVDRKKCSNVSGQAVVKDFRDVIKRITPATLLQTNLKKSMRRFKALIGSGRYLICNDYQSGYMAISQITYYIAKDKRYRVRIELGYED